MNPTHLSHRAPLIGLILICCLSGCASVDQKIGLNYARTNDSIVKPSGDVTISHIDSTSLSKSASGEWIIGSLNNVYGVHQANLLSDRSPGEWIAQALRVALTGKTVSPGIDEVMVTLGKARVIQRLERAIAHSRRS